MHIIAAMALAYAPAASPAGSIPPADWPEPVRMAVKAIGAGDAAALAARFRAIRELWPDNQRIGYVTAAAALASLSGCRRTRVTHWSGDYAIHFSCPAHKRVGCDSGDIAISPARIDWLETLTLRHERAVTPACPVFVAPPPVPLRPRPQP